MVTDNHPVAGLWIAALGILWSLWQVTSCSPQGAEPAWRVRVVSIGDWDDDGVSDFAVGEDRIRAVRLVSGIDGAVLRRIDNRGRIGALICSLHDSRNARHAVAAIDPSAGKIHLAFQGTGKSHAVLDMILDATPWSVLPFDDVDGDGLEDIAIGYVERNSKGAFAGGFARIISSNDGSVLWTARPKSSSTQIGFELCRAPDSTNDAVSELVVGSRFSRSANIYCGASGDLIGVLPQVGVGMALNYSIRAQAGSNGVEYYVSNPDTRAGGTIAVFNAAGTTVHSFHGERYGERFGHEFVFANRIGSGPYEFLLVGSPGEPSIGGGLPMMPLPLAGAQQEHAYLPGRVKLLEIATGRTVWKRSRGQPGDQFGFSFCSIDDVDGDGIGDFAVAGLDLSKEQTVIEVLSGSNGEELISLWL